VGDSPIAFTNSYGTQVMAGSITISHSRTRYRSGDAAAQHFNPVL
jgi:hypothetical protein